LSHTSGFPAGDCAAEEWQFAWKLHFGRKRPAIQRLDVVRRLLSRVPPARAPGPPSAYSNQNYAIAAVMLERATGVDWEELVRTRLFAPLGMASAGLGPAGCGAPTAAVARAHPWGHSGNGPGEMVPAHPDAKSPASDNPDVIAPAGKVHACIADWARFVAAHVDDEYASRRLGLSPETFALLHSPAHGAEHACGWIVCEREWAGGIALTHSGFNTLNCATVWAAPSRGFALMAACNAFPPGVHEAVDRAIQALLPLNREQPLSLPPTPSNGRAVSSLHWRVTNAQPLTDHWNIGELDMLLGGGASARHDIKRVICSFNYNHNDLSVVHNGEWFTGGGADARTWAGADTSEGQQPGGSWLGFEFNSPQTISGVTLAQGADDFPGAQGVAEAWLEALVDGEWSRVATLHFDSPVSQALVVVPSVS